MSLDWADWHRAYDDPDSPLNTRLRAVQALLAESLTAVPPGPVRLVSLCACQGRDVLGVLPDHPRRSDVTAVLVEYDPRIAAVARREAAAAGLGTVQVRQADAGLVASYADALPADVLLLCGIFGNISEDDIRGVVTATPALCSPAATVIWTRTRRAPDLTPRLRSWFAAAGFDEVAFEALPSDIGVGVHRLTGPAAGPEDRPRGRLFAFASGQTQGR